MEERRRISTDAQAFEEALRRVLSDEELVKRFWHRGYDELTNHAGNNASSEAAAIRNAWDAAWSAARALDALAAALRLVGTHEALYNASEAAGAAETMREWAGTMAGNK